MLRRKTEGSAAVRWPAGLERCRPAAQQRCRDGRVKTQHRWFLQSLLVKELAARQQDVACVQTSVEALKQIVDEEDQEAAEGEEEVFPDHLKFVVDVAVRGGVAHEPRAASAAESEDYVGSLLSILGFCDESTAHDVLSLLKQTARSVTEYADTLDRVLTHDDETPDLQLARQLLALLWVQKTSAHDLIAGLQQGGSIQALLESGLAHDSASTRARAYNCVVQAGMNAAPDSASVDAAVALLCRAALYDLENRLFLLASAWDLLLVNPGSGQTELRDTERLADDGVNDPGPTTALAFLLGYLRYGKADEPAACATAVGAARLVMLHPDGDNSEVLLTRLNAALVRVRQLERAKVGTRKEKKESASRVLPILQEFQARFKESCEEAAEGQPDGEDDEAAPAPSNHGYVGHIANALTWLVVEYLCSLDLDQAEEEEQKSVAEQMESALRQQPFRDQFDNLAGLVSLTTDSNFGLTFEIFAYNLVGNLRDNLPDDVTAEAVESAVGSLRRSFPLS